MAPWPIRRFRPSRRGDAISFVPGCRFGTGSLDYRARGRTRMTYIDGFVIPVGGFKVIVQTGANS